MDVKSFVLGYNAGASRNGGNGDQHVILTIAMDSWSETRSIGLTTWITSAIPLDDVTRQTMIRLSALDTETAADWSAGQTGAEITYNEDAETYSLRIGVIGARPTRDWQILMETSTVEETEGVMGPWVSVIPPVTDATDKVTNHNYDEMSHPELRKQVENNTAGLVSLAERVIDRTVSDLVNYYTKSQTLTKDEINVLVSAIPKFKIEVVTSLPASNISETTVYLVKSGDDDTNLYTEYIRTGDKWEKLGTQTVDLTGYATEAWVNDILAAYVKTVDMETYVTGLLNSYLTKEVADETYQPAGDYPTTAEMGTAISEATQNLAPKSSIPTKVSQLANDKEYLTPTAGDQRYAKPSDIPTVPQTLPNPYALNILGKTYNGSSAVEVTVDEIITALKQSGEAVIGAVGDDKTITLDGDLAPGTYTFAYVVPRPDGTTETVTIGTYTVEDESETKTYTITWANYDGTELEIDTVTEGETPAYKGATPTRAEDSQYTYTFAGWTPEVVAATADATYTATYTQTAKPVEPTATNFADPSSADWKNGHRLSTDAFGSKAVEGAAITNFVDVKYGDIVTVTGINFTDSENRQTFSDGSNPIGIGKASDWVALALRDTIDDITYDANSFTFKVVYGQSGKIIQARFSGLLTGAATDVVINIKRDGAWLTA